jgi:hypothetical protein
LQHCKGQARPDGSVVIIDEVAPDSIGALLMKYGLELCVQPEQEPITASFWGGEEAGIIGRTVYVRGDTPVHSFLHEACHIICMTKERRQNVERDAGGDDLEETAVCYLQVILADQIDGAGRERLMRDMDAWGYSFRLGDTRSWFERDAEDARKWLIDRGLLTPDGEATFRLRA